VRDAEQVGVQGAEVDGGRGVGDVGDDLQAGPEPGGPRERDRVQPELLVHARREHHPGRVEVAAAALDLGVQPAERGALVAGDEHAGVVAAGVVEPTLVEQQPHDRVDAGHERPSAGGGVAVVERDGHRCSSRGAGSSQRGDRSSCNDRQPIPGPVRGGQTSGR
jgi:hypothetical protein